MNRPTTPTQSPAKQAAMARAMRKKIQDVEATFAQFDTDGSGYISHPEFILALRRLGIKGVSDDDSAALLVRFREPGNSSGEMTLNEFRACISFFLHIPASAGAQRDEAADSVQVLHTDLHARLGAGEAGGEALSHAFAAHDPHKRGEVDLADMRVVVERILGEPLRDVAYKALVAKYDPDDVGAFLYNEWASEFSNGAFRAAMQQEEAREWVEVPALHAAGLRPIINPISRKLYSAEEIVKKGAVNIGMPENELRMILFLMHRKEELVKALKAVDVRGDGHIRKAELGDVLEGLGLVTDENLLSSLSGRCTQNADGKLAYNDLVRRFSPFLHPSDIMLDKMLLEKDPAVAKARAKAAARPSPVLTSPPDLGVAGRTLAGGSAASGSSTPKRGPLGAVAASYDDDRGSVATGAMDLSPTVAKLRKVLGSSWSGVLAETLKAQAKVGGSGDGLVSGTVLRDMLAAKGVALTSKELRALSLRFHGGGPVVTRDGDASGVVDVPALMKETFGSGKPTTSPIKLPAAALRTTVRPAHAPQPKALTSASMSITKGAHAGETRGIF